MKKTLLLSVVASTLIMAGGDIEPVAVPVVEEVSNWEFGGQGVVYYQTVENADFLGTGDSGLFNQTSSLANAGIQLRAANKDVAWGIGAGVEVNGLATLGLENDVVSNVMQNVGRADLRGGWISQAYLTYGIGNTSIKAGRQELPKGLSPFAFSEGWNVFKNTFDSILVVNTDISNTTLVGAWVEAANFNGIGAGTDMANFGKANGGSGIYMATIQNKSVEGLTVTGTWYYGASTDSIDTFGEDLNILWGDAKYAMNNFTIAGQIGTVMSDEFTVANGFANDDDTLAFGLKAGGKFDMFDAALIYTSVDESGLGVFNVGGVKTPLYSQLILNQDFIRFDSDTFVAKAGMKALGGKFGAAFNYSTVFDDVAAGAGELTYTEFDLTYKTKVFNDTTTLFAGYIYRDVEFEDSALAANDWDDNVLRFWGRYNF